MEILNLYTGIGGNRKIWGSEHNITAVEFDPDIAMVYKDMYPNDTIIVGDAHEYLLNHYKEFDFIWASPPCPTHSRIRRCGIYKGQYDALYPAMELYQEIILLQNFARKDTMWVVENVKPYYDYLIKPSVIIGRHPFWANFDIPFVKFDDNRVHGEIKAKSTIYGVSLYEYTIRNKRKILRNMVNPDIGKYILDVATSSPFKQQVGLFDENIWGEQKC